MNRLKLLSPSQMFIAVKIDGKEQTFYDWYIVVNTYDSCVLGTLNIENWCIVNGITLTTLVSGDMYIKTSDVERFVIWYNANITEISKEYK